jgi:putative transposase
MRQIEKHLIKPSHKLFKEIDSLCFKSKNLYNSAVYLNRQLLFSGKKRLNYYDLNSKLKESESYKALPAKVAQQTLMLVDRSFKSYEKAHKDWQKSPHKYLGEPKYPRYKDKTKGRYPLVYTRQAISKLLLKKGIIQLSKTNIRLKTKLVDIQQVRLIPVGNNYKIEIVYELKEIEEQTQNHLVAGVDIGLNNLATVVSNAEGFKPLLICGKAVKSVNQHFNKKKAGLQSRLTEKRRTSKKIQALSAKRNHKIDYYLHTASRFLINQCLEHKIPHLIIGKNPQWKQSINLGKRNNQSFTSIPHAKFIEQLEYKAKLVGIKVTITEESYTSKCSFADLEPIKKHSTYLGKRVKRGLFTSSKGFKYNADCNGSGNIIRKVVGNSLFSQQDSIVRCVVHPVRVKPYKANTVDICLQN